MNKKKFRKEVRDLNEEQIREIRKRLENEKYNLDTTVISIETLKKEIELDLIMRGSRMQLANFEEQRKRMEGNIKALEKQLRTKQIVNIVPK